MDTLKNKGFSLIEVMIAITMFSIFISAYMISQGGNIASSTLMAEEITLKNLAQQKINEIILDPPIFTESLNGKKDSKNFESPYADYRYTVTFKKLEVPDFEQVLMGGGTGDITDNNQQLDQVKKMVFEQLKENIEKMVWQVEVEVKPNGSDFNFILSTWILNTDERVQLNVNF
jgi:prepilin-type N-terminal cleavage/methylation domain-containing protein